MGNVRDFAVGTAVAGLLIAGAVGPLFATKRQGAPEAVSPSPAAGLGEALVEVRCPTFAWAGVEGASGYELVVLAVPAGAVEDEAAEPLVVTRAQLAAGARAWVPSLGSCLERGGQYAWSVRAVTPAGEAPWSEPALFRVAAGPSVQEVEAAMETLRRFVSDERPEGEVMADAEVGVERRAEARRETSRQGLGEARDRRASDGQEGAEARQRRSPGPMDLLVAGAEGGPELALASAPVLGSPSLSVTSNIALGTTSNLFKDGAVFLWDDDSANTALGRKALGSASGNASNNTAVGRGALQNTTEGLEVYYGSFNTAVGHAALYANTDGHSNTATGARTLRFNKSGQFNTASGYRALHSNKDDQNTAVGALALSYNTSGRRNVALGFNAGYRLGLNNETGHDNIFISNHGVADDSKKIRIGTQGTQNGTFIAGINGVATGLAEASTVFIDDNGQLGTASSSRAVKRDIQEVGVLSERLLALRAVAFRYEQHAERDPDGPLQFGLIAEEVAEVFPDLVIYGANGQPRTIRYHLLSTLLLNELQREHQRGLAHERELAEHRRELAQLVALRERISALESDEGPRETKPRWWRRGGAGRDSP